MKRIYKKIMDEFEYSENSIYDCCFIYRFPNGYEMSVVNSGGKYSFDELKNLLYMKIRESKLITGYEKPNKKRNKKGKKYKNSGKLKGKTTDNFNPAVLNNVTNRQICSL